jgi:aminoglycoside/choline kinase family phosphotransferase
MNFEERLQELIAGKLRIEGAVKGVEKMHGDASYRTYYRLSLEDGRTFIVMRMPEGKASVSEEVTNFNGTHRELPYINVSNYLERQGLPVPKILLYSGDDHIMILDDLGDRLMSREVENAGRQKLVDWYRKAIDLLVRMQSGTEGGGEQDCVAFARSFDTYLLGWEFRHFLEFGIEARVGSPIDEDDLKTFETTTGEISSRIAELPYGFTHRDFQSRNLIVNDGKLFMIDFQDALMGPHVYDLVALTRDSYVKLHDDLVEELVAYYSSQVDRDREAVRLEYDLVTVQRKLKDAGRFVYIDRVKGNPNFLKYIPDSLGYARDALERLPEYGGLARAIEKYLPEWK